MKIIKRNPLINAEGYRCKAIWTKKYISLFTTDSITPVTFYFGTRCELTRKFARKMLDIIAIAICNLKYPQREEFSNEISWREAVTPVEAEYQRLLHAQEMYRRILGYEDVRGWFVPDSNQSGEGAISGTAYFTDPTR